MTDEELVNALKALAHPVRMRIMRALADKERNVGELDEATEVGQPTLSQQLAVLRNAGLVKTRKDAKLVYYRTDENQLSKISNATGELAKPPAGPARHTKQPTPGVANFARLS